MTQGKPNSPEETLKLLPRAVLDTLRLKMEGTSVEDIRNWSGSTLKSWRTKAPKVSQGDLGNALGLCRITVCNAERRQSLTPRFSKRFCGLYERLIKPRSKSFEDPESGRLAEDEFAEALGNLRKLTNKYRPLLGKGVMNQRVEELVRSCDSVLLDLYQESVRLQRASEVRKRVG